MGVGITAYSRLNLTDHRRTVEEPWCEDYEDHISAYAYACFARSFEGLAGADVVWGYEDGRLVIDGTQSLDGGDWLIGTSCYERTPETVEADVLSMSYGGYNRWRDAVSLAATGMDSHSVLMSPSNGEAPFRDLICFADNEGCIGPVAAARLAADFANAHYREQFEKQCLIDDLGSTRIEFWVTAWDGWLNGTRLAADGGLIHFH